MLPCRAGLLLTAKVAKRRGSFDSPPLHPPANDSGALPLDPVYKDIYFITLLKFIKTGTGQFLINLFCFVKSSLHSKQKPIKSTKKASTNLPIISSQLR